MSYTLTIICESLQDVSTLTGAIAKSNGVALQGITNGSTPLTKPPTIRRNKAKTARGYTYVTPEHVVNVKALAGRNFTPTQIANRVKLSSTSVNRILNGEKDHLLPGTKK